MVQIKFHSYDERRFQTWTGAGFFLKYFLGGLPFGKKAQLGSGGCSIQAFPIFW